MYLTLTNFASLFFIAHFQTQGKKKSVWQHGPSAVSFLLCRLGLSSLFWGSSLGAASPGLQNLYSERHFILFFVRRHEGTANASLLCSQVSSRLVNWFTYQATTLSRTRFILKDCGARLGGSFKFYLVHSTAKPAPSI